MRITGRLLGRTAMLASVIASIRNMNQKARTPDGRVPGMPIAASYGRHSARVTSRSKDYTNLTPGTRINVSNGNTRHCSYRRPQSPGLIEARQVHPTIYTRSFISAGRGGGKKSLAARISARMRSMGGRA